MLKLPIPTDNLYKFKALTGLMLIIICGYLLKSSTENLFNLLDKLQVQETIYNSSSKNISINYLQKNEKLTFEVNKRYLKSQIDRLHYIMGVYFVFFTLGVILSINGFWQWYFRTQIYQDLILKNQANKYLEEKNIYVHSKQFEKEFAVYQELWKELAILLNKTQELRPIFEIHPSSKTTVDINIQKSESFTKAYNSCIEIFEYNKPFYPESVYKKIEAMIMLATHEMIDFSFEKDTEKSKDYYENGKKNIEEMTSKIEEICNKIRERIGLLKVNEFS